MKKEKTMANSPNIRIPMEDHEEAEAIALMKSAKDQKIISKNEVLKLAVKAGLKQLREEYGSSNKKTRTNKR